LSWLYHYAVAVAYHLAHHKGIPRQDSPRLLCLFLGHNRQHTQTHIKHVEHFLLRYLTLALDEAEDG
jgi:hypothetical protein